MAIKSLTLDDLRVSAESCGLSLSDGELAQYLELMEPRLAAYQLIEAMDDVVPETACQCRKAYRPLPDENRYNAWYQRTAIKGASEGRLKDYRVALKDNIFLAGIPMMNGSSLLAGHVPQFDATVVTRLLAAGAEIVGKTHCEYFCLSGGSHTNSSGPVHNPHRHGFAAGGSSSGAAVVVALNEADMAIGGDQGGSIRMPAALCGIVGMKPTYGLVPCTGVMSLERSLDHIGPMTRTVADNALMLEVIAGDDGLDTRSRLVQGKAYTDALNQDVAGLRIGILQQGFASPHQDAEVSARVRQAGARFQRLGADVFEVSVPDHTVALAAYMPILTEGVALTLFHGDGYGAGGHDVYSLPLMDALHRWRTHADELAPTAKFVLLLGQHMLHHHGNRHYAKAMNIVRRIRRAYDDALASCDLLLMPTTPITAKPMPLPGAPLEHYIRSSYDLGANTAPFNLTHHPSLSFPCGLVDGLPVGTMLVGKHFDEMTLYRAAHAFERSFDWTDHAG